MFNRKLLRVLSARRQVIRENGVLIVEHELRNRCGLGVFILASGHATEVDAHRARELWLVLSGQGSLWRDGHEHEVAPGSVFAFSPFQEHRLLASAGQAVTVLNIWWHDD